MISYTEPDFVNFGALGVKYQFAHSFYTSFQLSVVKSLPFLVLNYYAARLQNSRHFVIQIRSEIIKQCHLLPLVSGASRQQHLLASRFDWFPVVSVLALILVLQHF